MLGVVEQAVHLNAIGCRINTADNDIKEVTLFGGIVGIQC